MPCTDQRSNSGSGNEKITPTAVFSKESSRSLLRLIQNSQWISSDRKLSWHRADLRERHNKEATDSLRFKATFVELEIRMAPNNSSFPFNQPTGQGNLTATTHEDLLVCAPFSNAIFESLDTSIPYFFNAALNVPLAVATTFANLVVLLAMRRVTSIRLPSKLLLCSLVLTDLGAGSVVQPQWAALLVLWGTYPNLVQCPLYKSFVITGSTLGTALVLTLAAISLDRYAALFFHLKYQQIVTTRGVCAVLAFIWALALLLPLTSLWDHKLWHASVATVLAVAYLVIFVACIKIYRRLRVQQIQPQAPDPAQQQAGNTLNTERYRRTASVMMLVFVLLLICLLPFWCLFSLRAAPGKTALTECLFQFSCTLVFLNSFLNPFVYCLRLPEIRTEVVKQLRKLLCRSNSAHWLTVLCRIDYLLTGWTVRPNWGAEPSYNQYINPHVGSRTGLERMIENSPLSRIYRDHEFKWQQGMPCGYQMWKTETSTITLLLAEKKH